MICVHQRQDSAFDFPMSAMSAISSILMWHSRRPDFGLLGWTAALGCGVFFSHHPITSPFAGFQLPFFGNVGNFGNRFIPHPSPP
ncbi:MAG TPA: hypothetical protein VJV96_11670, partial [Candidatus Angelobacter sp.]|nr:hypothetical protein [Candidatus Angelobacter sp.]